MRLQVNQFPNRYTKMKILVELGLIISSLSLVFSHVALKSPPARKYDLDFLDSARQIHNYKKYIFSDMFYQTSFKMFCSEPFYPEQYFLKPVCLKPFYSEPFCLEPLLFEAILFGAIFLKCQKTFDSFLKYFFNCMVHMVFLPCTETFYFPELQKQRNDP